MAPQAPLMDLLLGLVASNCWLVESAVVSVSMLFRKFTLHAKASLHKEGQPRISAKFRPYNGLSITCKML